MAEKKFILTKEDRETLEKEYRDLIDVQRPDVIAKLQLARSQGDLSENADYDAARDRQAQIEGRIVEIENIFNNSVAADSGVSAKSASHIGIGDTVTLKDVSAGMTFKVKIAGNTGANPTAETPIVSNESPIGKALLGRVAGESVTVPVDQPYEVEILEIAR